MDASYKIGGFFLEKIMSNKELTKKYIKPVILAGHLITEKDLDSKAVIIDQDTACLLNGVVSAHTASVAIEQSTNNQSRTIFDDWMEDLKLQLWKLCFQPTEKITLTLDIYSYLALNEAVWKTGSQFPNRAEVVAAYIRVYQGYTQAGGKDFPELRQRVLTPQVKSDVIANRSNAYKRKNLVTA